MMRVVISSGHGLYVRGARGDPVPPQCDEVDEARRIVERVAQLMANMGHDVTVFHDDESHDVETNLATIVDAHNSVGPHDLDVSVHLNCYDHSAHGVEVCYKTQKELAAKVSAAIAAVGFTDRGPKLRDDLYVLNKTDAPCILIETFFCDHTGDCTTYREKFDAVCVAIAESITGDVVDGEEVEPPDEPARPERPDPPPILPPPDHPPPEPDEPDEMSRPTIREGDYGSAVRLVQENLGLNPDGDFGPVTDEAVRDFQNGHNLDDDGKVGPMTWDALDDEYDLPPYPMPFLPPLSPAVVRAIEQAAEESDVAALYWGGPEPRGQAPIGYIQGMALAYATLVRKFKRGDGAAFEMAKADTGDTDTDALALYRDQFQKLGMDNSHPGRKTLRHVAVFLTGLGMQESSGEHCCGIDASAGASSESSDTCEAGLFQQSYNSHVCCTDIDAVMAEYRPGLGEGPSPPQCQLAAFQRDVSCGADDWENYGSGTGRDFQALCKECPAFAVEAAAIGIRNLCAHWGPIGRMEVQISVEANHLFEQVDRIIDAIEEVA